MRWVISAPVAALLFLLSVSLTVGAESTATQRTGDLVVTWGKTEVIENTTYVQRGNIYVEDGGTLILRNVTLAMQTDYDFQYKVYVRGQGKLEATNVQLVSRLTVIEARDLAEVTLSEISGEGLTLWLWGSSTATVSDSTVTMLDVGDTAHLEMSSSTVEGFLRLQLKSRQVLTLRGLVSGHQGNVALPTEQPAGMWFSIRLSDTSVASWVVAANTGSHVTIEDSQVGMVVALGDATGKIEGLPVGRVADWDSSTLALSGFPTSIHLVNTEIIDAMNNYWYLYTSGDGPIEVDDSNVGLGLNGAANVVVRDSIVTGIGGSHTGSVTFANTLLQCYANFDGTHSSWKGDVQIAGDIRIGAWNATSIRRTYEVKVVDSQQRPVVGARVRVTDAMGTTAVERVTDSGGTAQFDIVFTDANYRSAWTVTLPDRGVDQLVTFLTSTPLVLVVRT
jgi:hypothetical protein